MTLKEMAAMPRKTLGIIGCGNVGKALGRAWTTGGTLIVQDILNRSVDSARRAASFISAGQAVARHADLRPADLYLIATGDDQIAACCDALARTGVLSGDTVVFHCSGALTSDELRAARHEGAAIASIHPIRSFADPAQIAADFSGTCCGVEGDQRALDILDDVFSALGARFVPVDADFKMLYHAAAVFASNYLVTLLDVAVQAYAQAGVPQQAALELMAPLVRKTVDNVLKMGPADALTGPIARGDMQAALKQQQAVAAWNNDYGELYRRLAMLTADLAGQPRTPFL